MQVFTWEHARDLRAAMDEDYARAERRRRCHGVLKANRGNGVGCDICPPDGRPTKAEVKAKLAADPKVRELYAKQPPAFHQIPTVAAQLDYRSLQYQDLTERTPLLARLRRECHGIWKTGKTRACYCYHREDNGAYYGEVAA